MRFPFIDASAECCFGDMRLNLVKLNCHVPDKLYRLKGTGVPHRPFLFPDFRRIQRFAEFIKNQVEFLMGITFPAHKP
jgi:hypothetical protein